MNQEILNMPKVELHCHLDGSLTLASVREILGKDISPEELQVQPDCQNLAEYLQKFDLPIQCLQTPEGIKKASRDFTGCGKRKCPLCGSEVCSHLFCE